MTPSDRLRHLRLPVAWLLLAAPLAWWTTVHLAGGWVPHGDTAVAAVRVHDVFGTHTPLLGMPSTSGLVVEGVHAHHPGPLHFQLLAPLYALSGFAPWALVVGSFLLLVALVGVALAAAGAVAGRRGWATVVVVLAPALLLVGGGLVVPWNPWVAIFALTAAVASGWAVLAGNPRWWPAFIVTLSLAAQSHVAIAPVAVVLGAIVLAVSVVRWRSGRESVPRRTAAITTVLGVACWTAPLADVATRRPHNLELLLRVAGAGDGVPASSLLAVGAGGAVLWWCHRRGSGLASGAPGAVVPWLAIGAAVLALSATRAGEGRVGYVAIGYPVVLLLLAWPLVSAIGRSRRAPQVALVGVAAVALGLLVVPRPLEVNAAADAERAAPVVERAKEMARDVEGPIAVTSAGSAAWLDIGPAVYAALLADGHDVYFDARVDGVREDDFRHPRHLRGPRHELRVQSHAGQAEAPPEGAITERVDLPETPGAAVQVERFVDLVLSDRR
ncbi:hypothetical protein AFL01nite_29110 [Aeromicrobium flavum]|uniref:Glycosyltransferase RgtA/B/C/D-like domain-containing protein n=1 Tax=Aeromicrobium flavum TaxID=416568 RepID=A0A512HYT0_9ACTN|nr:hypothetical protein [Aeromicrobium flavum]GEO90584.1 hypothetical protein AFL01nite_29110 [Aeromicrobium flavum]